MPAAIEIDDISKHFRLYHEKYTSLKERVIHLNKIPFEEFWALQHISFDVNWGETVGLVGHNGSGKSTLLKCIAAILQPTSGEIRVRGRVAAMLELGAGFHPELSGRENIYLNAALLGVAKRDIDLRFDDIVEFSELGPFIDNQVRYYSSGMYTRLGFAVAVNVDPDILLVDEVLAVGDENFQRKCFDKVEEFQREGRTIVFVSHSPEIVRRVCDRAYVLDHGVIVGEGTAPEAISILREYQARGSGLASMIVSMQEIESDSGGEAVRVAMISGEPEERVMVGQISVSFPSTPAAGYLNPGDPMTVTVSYTATRHISGVIVGIQLFDQKGDMVFGTDSDLMGLEPLDVDPEGELEFNFPSVPVTDGLFSVAVGFTSARDQHIYDWQNQELAFKVISNGKSSGYLKLDPRLIQNGSAVPSKG
ncbi:MAG: ABC transporter ATP-binding protein [Actinomycetota bacterium]|nr:ABC transporter ATP-binding protein [Actinomycetota bacterium]